MKRFFSFFLLLLFWNCGYSQTNYEIKSVGKKYSAEQLSQAFNSADFCGSFCESKRNRIVFDDGSVVELLSRKELEAQGKSLSTSCFLSDDIKLNESVWSVTTDGRITKGHPHTLEKNQVIQNTKKQ
jgi:hypothetical protein